MTTRMLLFVAAVAGCQGTVAAQDPGTPTGTAESIDWTLPPHITSGLGAKPWHGALAVPGGTLDPATGNVSHPVGDWLVWVSLDAGTLHEAGFGMRLAVVERLVVTGGDVTWLRPDGESVVFTRDGAGGYVSPVETDATLALSYPGHYDLRFPGATRMMFEQPNGAGWLEVAIVDRNGNAITFSYDAADRLVGLIDPIGAGAQLAYGGDGLLARIAEPDGQAWNLGYNGWSELVAITRESDGATHVLTYDPYYLHLLEEHRSPQGQSLARFDYYYDRSLKGAADVAGAKLVVGYYASQVRLADSYHQITTLDFTLNGEVGRVIDPIGVPVARTAYDASHRVASTTDSTGYTTSLQYDASNNVVRVTTGDGDITTATYAGHDVTSVTSPTGKTTSYTYGPHDEVTSVVDPMGRRTDLGYDANGNLLTVRASDGTIVASYAYGPGGELFARTDANGDTEYFRYDIYRNLTLHLTPTWRTWRFAATPDGRPTSLTTPQGQQTTFAYDAANRLSRVDSPDLVTETSTWDRDDRLLERRRRYGGPSLRDVGSNESVEGCNYDNRGGVGESCNDTTVEACAAADAYDDPEVPPPTDTSTDTGTDSGTDTTTATSTAKRTR